MLPFETEYSHIYVILRRLFAEESLLRCRQREILRSAQGDNWVMRLSWERYYGNRTADGSGMNLGRMILSEKAHSHIYVILRRRLPKNPCYIAGKEGSFAPLRLTIGVCDYFGRCSVQVCRGSKTPGNLISVSNRLCPALLGCITNPG